MSDESAHDDRMFNDIVERELFLELVTYGTPVNLAGLEVGWTFRQTKRNLADPEFAELIEYAKIHRDDRIEKTLYTIAEKGNMPAIAMILLNRRADQFRDVKRIEVKSEHTVSIGIVHSVKQSVLELIQEHGVEALQLGSGLDVIDADSTED